MMKRVIFLIVFALICGAEVGPQKPDQDDVVRVESDITNLRFTATDREQRFITTLRAEDLRGLEAGATQTLFTFPRGTDRPLIIAFLIAVSRSQEATLPDDQ